MMNKKCVVVIGFGGFILIGNDVEIVWKNVVVGVSGVGFLIRLDVDEFLVKVVVEVKDFNVEDFIDCKEVCKMDCFI